jgi:hypothetical protein
MKSEINLWDNLPGDIQKMILEFRAVKTIQRNIKRHPAIRSIYIAKACMERRGYNICIDVTKSSNCWGLEYCAKHSGLKNIQFWVKFSYKLLDEIDNVIYWGYSNSKNNNIFKCLNIGKILIENFEREIIVTEEEKINFKRRIEELENIRHRYFINNSYSNLHYLINKSNVLNGIVIEKDIKEYYECFPWCF